MLLHAMIELLAMKQFGDPTQIGFDRKALVPPPAFAALDILRRRVFGPQALIRQHDRLAIVSGCQWTKDIVGLIGCIPTPVDNLTRIVDQPGQLDADDPAPVRFAFLTNLTLAAPFAPWMNQLDSIGIHNCEEGWVS